MHHTRIAVLNPLGDYGINQYVYELCEGLAAHGVTADVYTPAAPDLPAPLHHRRFHVYGSLLFKQQRGFGESADARLTPADPEWIVQATTTSPQTVQRKAPEFRYSHLRRTVLTAEMLLHLARKRYDWVWTQWPYLDPYYSQLFAWMRWLGMPVVHTVHNVLPHEWTNTDVARCGHVYRSANALVVHSQMALAQLRQQFPDAATKAITSSLMTYTLFPRSAEARSRVRDQLGLQAGQALAIFTGAIRPYKNVEAFVDASVHPALSNTMFVVAGKEAGYPNLDPQDSLAGVRRRIKQLGVEDRFRLIPRNLTTTEMAELFEAADVAILPYLHGDGSAQLLLAMTFGKAIVSTAAGGAAEYLAQYPRSAIIERTDADAIAEAVHRALGEKIEGNAPMSRLQGAEVAGRTLKMLAEIVPRISR